MLPCPSLVSQASPVTAAPMGARGLACTFVRARCRSGSQPAPTPSCGRLHWCLRTTSLPLSHAWAGRRGVPRCVKLCAWPLAKLVMLTPEQVCASSLPFPLGMLRCVVFCCVVVCCVVLCRCASPSCMFFCGLAVFRRLAAACLQLRLVEGAAGLLAASLTCALRCCAGTAPGLAVLSRCRLWYCRAPKPLCTLPLW